MICSRLGQHLWLISKSLQLFLGRHTNIYCLLQSGLRAYFNVLVTHEPVTPFAPLMRYSMVSGSTQLWSYSSWLVRCPCFCALSESDRFQGLSPFLTLQEVFSNPSRTARFILAFYSYVAHCEKHLWSVRPTPHQLIWK